MSERQTDRQTAQRQLKTDRYTDRQIDRQMEFALHTERWSIHHGGKWDIFEAILNLFQASTPQQKNLSFVGKKSFPYSLKRKNNGFLFI